MATQDSKLRPVGLPPVFQELEEKLQQAAANPEASQQFKVGLQISGGVYGERYGFSFDAWGKGYAEFSMSNQLTGLEYESRTLEVSQEDLRELFGALDLRMVMEAAQPQAPIPPDSLIGRLEISDGAETVSIVFMADPEQAETAGYRIPPHIARVVDTFFDLAAKRFGAEDIRP